MRIGTLLALFWLTTVVSSAQTLGGSLRGVVEDGEGARVASAAIFVHLNASSLERSARCDDHGNFRMDDLKPGTYRVSVSAHGFAEAVADVSVAVGSVRDITVTLQPPAVSQTLTSVRRVLQ